MIFFECQFLRVKNHQFLKDAKINLLSRVKKDKKEKIFLVFNPKYFHFQTEKNSKQKKFLFLKFLFFFRLFFNSFD